MSSAPAPRALNRLHRLLADHGCLPEVRLQRLGESMIDELRPLCDLDGVVCLPDAQDTPTAPSQHALGTGQDHGPTGEAPALDPAASAPARPADLIVAADPVRLMAAMQAGRIADALAVYARLPLTPTAPLGSGLGEVDLALRGAGLQLHSLRRPPLDEPSAAPRPTVARWLAADLVYFPAATRWHALSPDQLLRLALLTCSLGAEDLAADLLRRCDKRQQTDLAGAFASEPIGTASTAGGRGPAPAAGAAASGDPAVAPDRVAIDPPAEIRIDGGLLLHVPAPLELMTPYVLREQETWFEDEVAFVRRLLGPGMRVLDIGANYGVYTVPMAARVGRDGQVWAFEPTPATAEHLRRSLKANGLGQVQLIQAALSDYDGEAQLALSANAELNSLRVTGAPTETATCAVPVTTLDGAWERLGRPAIDFVKLDAEGEELRILAGAAAFLRATSPVIMCELKHGAKLNLELIDALREQGFGSYRLLPGADCLVPFDTAQPPDPYLLNLFACRADSAARLTEQGQLYTGAPLTQAPQPVQRWQQALKRRPFAAALLNGWLHHKTPATAHCTQALEHCLSAQSDTIGPALRHAHLRAALAVLQALPRPSLAARMTGVRVLLGLGERAAAVRSLDALKADLTRSSATLALEEPFLPPCPRYDDIDPGDRLRAWCLSAVLEQLDRSRAFSTYFSGPGALDDLQRLAELGFAGAEAERRRQLVLLRAGRQARPMPSPLLARRTADNLNPDYWQGAPTPTGPGSGLILAAGMPRSGSTWLFNAARVLLAQQVDGDEMAWGWIDDWPKLPRRRLILIKVHEYDDALAARASRVLYSYRDVRDAVASLKRKFEHAPTAGLADQLIQQDARWSARAAYSMRYETMLEDKPAVLAGIAQALGIAHPDIPGALAALDAISAPAPASGAQGYDKDTLLHPGHITDGRHGSWSGIVPADVIAAIEQRHAGWLAAHGYSSAPATAD